MAEAPSIRGRRTADILRQNAIPFLLYLSSNPGWHPPTKIAKAIRGAPRHAVGTAERLHEAGLVDIEPAGTRGDKGTFRIRSTDKGREVAELMQPVVGVFEPEHPARRSSGRARKR